MKKDKKDKKKDKKIVKAEKKLTQNLTKKLEVKAETDIETKVEPETTKIVDDISALQSQLFELERKLQKSSDVEVDKFIQSKAGKKLIDKAAKIVEDRKQEFKATRIFEISVHDWDTVDVNETSEYLLKEAYTEEDKMKEEVESQLKELEEKIIKTCKDENVNDKLVMSHFWELVYQNIDDQKAA